jgi:hypothetical protein
VIDERIALPKERALDQYVPWGHNGQLKLFSGQEAPGEGGRRRTEERPQRPQRPQERSQWQRAEELEEEEEEGGGSKTKPFEQWSADEVFRLIKSIGLDESAEAIKVNRINGKYFSDMLRNNDEDLTKSIADDGLGFKKLQLKVVKAKIEEIQDADS